MKLFHPACEALPPLPTGEFDALVQSIKEHGLIEAITRRNGVILDGKQRLLACEQAGVEPRFVEWTGDGDPTEWIVAVNTNRRHLNKSQLALLALQLLPSLSKSPKNLGDKADRHGSEATQRAAKKCVTNRQYVADAKRISQEAPDLVEPIRIGRIELPAARTLEKYDEAIRAEVLGRHENRKITRRSVLREIDEITRDRATSVAKHYLAETPQDDHGVLHCDMQQLAEILDDNSVDVICTDPPWGEIDCFEQLAKLAEQKLKPGGLCITFTGTGQFLDKLNKLAAHLKEWWCFSEVLSGGLNVKYDRSVKAAWHPIVAFFKPPFRKIEKYMIDCFAGAGRDKRYHAWGQSERTVQYLLEHVCSDESFVVDPFCGGGTTAAVCKKLGLRCITTDIDEEAVLRARHRVAEARFGEAPDLANEKMFFARDDASDAADPILSNYTAADALFCREFYEGKLWDASFHDPISRYFTLIDYDAVRSAPRNAKTYLKAVPNTRDGRISNVISRPPAHLAERFQRRAKKLARRTVSLLVDLGQVSFRDDHRFPLKGVWQFAGTNEAWMIWHRFHEGPPRFDSIHSDEFRLSSPASEDALDFHDGFPLDFPEPQQCGADTRQLALPIEA